MTGLSEKQADALQRMAIGAECTYYRPIGVLQPSAAATLDHWDWPRGAATIDALERRGLVRVDRTDYTNPCYPVTITRAGREAIA